MKTCSKCGAQLPDDAKFCGTCGTACDTPSPLLESHEGEKLESPDYDGIQVRLCTDGKYHWTYPMNMLKNPSIYFTVCKIFGILGGIAFLTIYSRSILHGDFSPILEDLKFWGIAILVFLAISAVSYLIVASMYGYRYIVRFTMDEKGLLHDQHSTQKKNAKKIGGALAGAGILTGHPGRVGQGMMVASHTSLSSDFSKVRSIKSFPGWNTIKVNEPFAHNQVYTTKEDFDFVLNFIKDHCPKAR